MKKYFVLLLVVIFNGIILSQQLREKISSKQYNLNLDKFSGVQLETPTEVYNGSISYSGANWIRLKFKEAFLGRNSYLIITSKKDGSWQKLNSASIEQWNFTSAYFNGDILDISLFVGPGDKEIFFSIDTIIVSENNSLSKNVLQPENLCGSDNRVSSDHKAIGRIVTSNLDPWGTGWILYDGRIVTAGHVVSGLSTLVIEFNVPNSTYQGSPQHPDPEDQYSLNLNQGSLNYHNNGEGDDWAVMSVYANSNTGLLPKEAQDAFFQVEQNNGAESIRVTGYGSDDGAAYCTQQTDVGNNNGTSGNIIGYILDTEGGDSGAPIINDTNGKAIGIHTHGHCSDWGYNVGTGFTNSGI